MPKKYKRIQAYVSPERIAKLWKSLLQNSPRYNIVHEHAKYYCCWLRYTDLQIALNNIRKVKKHYNRYKDLNTEAMIVQCFL